MIEDSKRPEPRFKGMMHGIRLIVAEEGYRGLYRGVGPVVCALHSPTLGPASFAYMPDIATRSQLCRPLFILFNSQAARLGIRHARKSIAWMDDIWHWRYCGRHHCLHYYAVRVCLPSPSAQATSAHTCRLFKTEREAAVD
jgi:hypothetical protein